MRCASNWYGCFLPSPNATPVTIRSTPLQFRRHLRIAMGSAAEAECLTRLAAEVKYLPSETTDELETLLERAMAALHGLIRKIPVRT